MCSYCHCISFGTAAVGEAIAHRRTRTLRCHMLHNPTIHTEYSQPTQPAASRSNKIRCQFHLLGVAFSWRNRHGLPRLISVRIFTNKMTCLCTVETSSHWDPCRWLGYSLRYAGQYLVSLTSLRTADHKVVESPCDHAAVARSEAKCLQKKCLNCVNIRLFAAQNRVSKAFYKPLQNLITFGSNGLIGKTLTSQTFQNIKVLHPVFPLELAARHNDCLACIRLHPNPSRLVSNAKAFYGESLSHAALLIIYFPLYVAIDTPSFIIRRGFDLRPLQVTPHHEDPPVDRAFTQPSPPPDQ